MTIIVSFLVFCGLYTHDTQVAFYKIKQEANTLEIEFIFEYSELLKTQDGQHSEMSDAMLQEYIDSHFAISLNKKSRMVSYGTMQKKHNHIFIIGKIHHIDQEIEQIEITNSCLIEIGGHSNIVEVYLGPEQRDFLMNSHRTSIQINY